MQLIYNFCTIRNNSVEWKFNCDHDKYQEKLNVLDLRTDVVWIQKGVLGTIMGIFEIDVR